MISKALPGHPLIITGIVLVLSIMLQCISDPANSSWGTDGDVTTENNYSYIRTVVQDTAGNFYALANRRIITFDEYDFTHNLPPDTLPLPYDTLRFFFDDPDILLDAFGRLVIISFNRIYLVQSPAESVRLTMLIETDSEIRFINMDHGIMMAATQSGDIYSWDGNVVKKYGNLPGNTGAYISGIFTDSNKTDVFTTWGCSNNNHFTIDGSDTIAQPVNANLYIPYYAFKINGRILAGGNSCTYISDNGGLDLFHLRPDNSIAIIEAIYPGSYESFQTADAVYLRSDYELYKITDSLCYRSTFSSMFGGPLYIDRHGRAALLYIPTRHMFILDSLASYVEAARW